MGQMLMVNYIYATLMLQDFISKHVNIAFTQAFFSDPNGLISASKLGNFKQIFSNMRKSGTSFFGGFLAVVGVVVAGICLTKLVWSFISKNNSNRAELAIGTAVGLIMIFGGYNIVMGFGEPLKQGTEDLLAGKTLE